VSCRIHRTLNTGHCFNDFNHVDATTMALDVSDNENRGAVDGRALHFTFLLSLLAPTEAY
jgi:hypothetical protein